MHNIYNAGLATVLLLSSFAIQADFKKVDVTNFNGQYNTPQGSGKADTFSIPIDSSKVDALNVQIEIFKGNENFQISVDENEYLWEDVPSTLLEMESLNWYDIDFNTDTQRVSFNIERLQGITSDKRLNLSKLSSNCQHTRSQLSGFLDNLLESCLNGTARLRINSFQNEDKSLFSDNSQLTRFIHILQGLQVKTPEPQQELEDIELDIQNNSFEARLKTKIVFNTTVKAEGKSYYDSDEKVIRLRIDKAKAGFINVKDKIFEELEKNQGPKLRVERPWVYLKVE